MTPLPMPTNHGADSRSTGERSFRAETQKGARRGSDRGRMAASKAPSLGITQKWDFLFGRTAEISQK